MGFPRKARYSILEKYQFFLKLNGKEEFNKGENPFQDTQLLIDLRNRFVHYEPESIIHMSSTDKKQEDMHQVERDLRNKFEPIKLDSFQHNNFYPDRCLSHGCAEWAVETVLKFIEDFTTKLGTVSTFDREREDFSTK